MADVHSAKNDVSDLVMRMKAEAQAEAEGDEVNLQEAGLLKAVDCAPEEVVVGAIDDSEDGQGCDEHPNEAVLAYANWLAIDLRGRDEREAALRQEVLALREAMSIGAAGLVELRNAIQDELQKLVARISGIEENLDETKRGLAEVVIDQSNTEDNLWVQLEKFADDLAQMRSNSHIIQEASRQDLESRIRDGRQALDRQVASLKQLLDASAPRSEVESLQQQTEAKLSQLQKILEHRTDEMVSTLKRDTNSVFAQLDEALYGKENGVVTVMDRYFEQTDRLSKAFDEAETARKAVRTTSVKLEGSVLSLNQRQDDLEKQVRTLSARGADDETPSSNRSMTVNVQPAVAFSIPSRNQGQPPNRSGRTPRPQ